MAGVAHDTTVTASIKMEVLFSFEAFMDRMLLECAGIPVVMSIKWCVVKTCALLSCSDETVIGMHPRNL